MILGQLSNYLIWHTSYFPCRLILLNLPYFQFFHKILRGGIDSKVVKQYLIHYVIVLKIVLMTSQLSAQCCQRYIIVDFMRKRKY
jgi:hypothetical protein